VDAGSKGEMSVLFMLSSSSWRKRCSSAPGVVYTRTRSVVALLLRGVCGPFRDPNDERVYASMAAAPARERFVLGVVGPPEPVV
jgi:hypothetical protein